MCGVQLSVCLKLLYFLHVLVLSAILKKKEKCVENSASCTPKERRVYLNIRPIVKLLQISLHQKQHIR